MATDVASPLPQVDLLHGSVITVTLDQAGAQITALNVHGTEYAETTTEPRQLVPGLV